MAKTWKEVTENPSYQSLSDEDKERAREQYFYDVVAPNATNFDQIDKLKNQFDEDTAPELKESEQPDTWGDTLDKSLHHTGQRLKATAGGVLQATGEQDQKLAKSFRHIAEKGITPSTAFSALNIATDIPRIIQESLNPNLKKSREKLAPIGKEIADKAHKAIEENPYNVEDGSAQYFVGHGAETLFGNILPALGIGLLTKNANSGLAFMGGQVYGDKYAQSRSEGRDEEQASMDAAFYAFSETITEKIPLEMAIKGGKGFLAKVLKTGSAEGVTEVINSVMQRAYDEGIVSPETDLKSFIQALTNDEALRDYRDAVVIGSGVGSSMGAIAYPFTKDQPDQSTKPEQPPNKGFPDLPQWNESSAEPDTRGPLSRALDTANKSGAVEEAAAANAAAEMDETGLSEDQQPVVPEGNDIQTIPEPKGDIQAQINAMMDKKTPKDTVFVANGTEMPDNIPKDTRIVKGASGTLITTNNAKAEEFKINESDEVVAKILGYGQSKNQLDELVKQGDEPVTLVVSDKDGHPIHEEVTTKAGFEEAYTRLDADYPGQVTGHNAEEVLNNRKLRYQQEQDAAEQDQIESDFLTEQAENQKAMKLADKNKKKKAKQKAQNEKLMQERDKDIDNLTAEDPEYILKTNGKPFGSESTAKQAATNRGYSDASVTPYEDGFALVRKKPGTKENEGKNSNLLNDIESFKKTGNIITLNKKYGTDKSQAIRKTLNEGLPIVESNINKLANQLKTEREDRKEKIFKAEEKNKKLAEKAKEPVTPKRKDSSIYTVNTEDMGDIEVQVIRGLNGEIALFDDKGTREYNADFAKDKTDEEVIAYSYEPLGYKASTKVEDKPDHEKDKVDDVLEKARSGDKKSQEQLTNYGLSWDGNKPKYRLVGKKEADLVLSGEKVESNRGHGTTDITDNKDYPSVSVDSDHRVTFKQTDRFDSDIETDTKEKNKDKNEYHLANGYSLDDVETVEQRQSDGTWKAVYSDNSKVNMPTGEEIAEAAKEGLSTHSGNNLKAPSEAQIEADNYKKIPVKYDGIDIKIETAAGEKRKPEWPALKHHYGDVKQTEGNDGDAIDVFINKDNERTDTPVFIVNQQNKDGTFDEHKALLGFNNAEEARQGYLDNYSKDWTAPEVIPEYSMDEFKEWLKTGDHKKEAEGPVVNKSENIVNEKESIKPVDNLSKPDQETKAQSSPKPKKPNAGKAGRKPAKFDYDSLPDSNNPDTRTTLKADDKFVSGFAAYKVNGFDTDKNKVTITRIATKDDAGNWFNDAEDIGKPQTLSRGEFVRFYHHDLDSGTSDKTEEKLSKDKKSYVEFKTEFNRLRDKTLSEDLGSDESFAAGQEMTDLYQKYPEYQDKLNSDLEGNSPVKNKYPSPKTSEEINDIPINTIYISGRNDGFKYSVRGDGRYGMGDTLHKKEVDAIADLEHQIERQESAEKAEKAEKSKEEEVAKKEAEYISSFNGFLGKNKMIAGQRRKALEKNIRVFDRVFTRKEMIENRIAKGYRVTGEGKDRFFEKDGAGLNQKDITKTGMDYAEFLQNKDASSKKSNKPAKGLSLKNITIQQEYTVDGKTKKYAVNADVALKLTQSRLDDLVNLRGCVGG
jgi:hypothetical protein